MKYCVKCGNEMLDEAVLCVKCGCFVESNKIKVKKEKSFVKNIYEKCNNDKITDILSFIMNICLIICGALCALGCINNSVTVFFSPVFIYNENGTMLWGSWQSRSIFDIYILIFSIIASVIGTVLLIVSFGRRNLHFTLNRILFLLIALLVVSFTIYSL